MMARMVLMMAMIRDPEHDRQAGRGRGRAVRACLPACLGLEVVVCGTSA